MPSYVNDVYVQRKLAHIDEQIEALKKRVMAVPLGGAAPEIASVDFQEERKSILIWATTATDDEIAKALGVFYQGAADARAALAKDGDLRNAPLSSVQSQAYWELIMCTVTPPDGPAPSTTPSNAGLPEAENDGASA